MTGVNYIGVVSDFDELAHISAADARDIFLGTDIRETE